MAVTVKVALPRGAVDSAARVTVSGALADRLNSEGVAVTPVGMPVRVTLACELNPFKAVRLMLTDAEDPNATETLVGCIVRVKSGGGETASATVPV